MKKHNYTANIDNIISIKVVDESIASIDWHPPTTKMRRIPWSIRIVEEEDVPGHY